MSEQSRIAIDQNGLSRCVRGELVYEPDIDAVAVPVSAAARARRPALAGRGAAAVGEPRVRRPGGGAPRSRTAFSSGDCEFLRQLSEHVALAAHQAQLHGALQQAYDDLRQTQQTVMQQERLRALGQMASGIAHDINNAISPVALYTESAARARAAASASAAAATSRRSQRAIDDVAAHGGAHARVLPPARAAADARAGAAEPAGAAGARPDARALERHAAAARRRDRAATPSWRRTCPPILGVESEIREALTNLVFNAVDAMPEGGTLTLRTRSTGTPARRQRRARVSSK